MGAYAIGAVLAVLATLGPRAALAQDSAAAQARFDEGVTLMEQKQYAVACPKFVESQAIEPKAGTLYALADCYAFSEAYASAVARYKEYLAAVLALPADQQSRHEERANSARAQLKALAPLVPQFKVLVEPSLPSNAHVFLEGNELPPNLLSEPKPIDPGTYKLRIVLDEAESAQDFSIAKGETKEVRLRVPRADEPRAAVEKEKPALPPPPPSSPGMHWMRLGALAAGGVGLVGLGVGAVTGMMVLQKKGSGSLGELLSRCPQNEAGAYACSGPNKEKDKTALQEELNGLKPLATVSTVGFVAGGVALAAGAALWFAAPRKSAMDVGVLWVGPTGGMVGARGVW